MKIKKLFATLVSAILLVGAAGVLASCDDEKPGGDVTPTPPPASDKEYQLLGSFTDDLGPLGKGFEFMLNLDDESTAALSRYNPYNYDASDASTNSSFSASYMSGTWKEAQKDGVDCLQIKLAVVNDDGTTSDSGTYYAYDVAGTYSFDLTFPIYPGGGFTRTVTMSGSETKVYSDANAFIQAKKLSFEEPENILKAGSVNAEGEEANGAVYFKADGTFAAYSGYTEFGSGTYSKSADSFAVTFEGEKVEVTLNGTEARFIITYNMGGGYSSEYTIVVSDFTKLPDVGGAEETTVTYLGTLNGEEIKLVVLNDTECKINKSSVFSMFSFDCTYTMDGNVITITVKSEPTNEALVGMWNDIKGVKWTLDSASNTMTPITE